MDFEDADMEGILGRYRPMGPPCDLRAKVLQRSQGNRRWFYARVAAAVLLFALTLFQFAHTGDFARSYPGSDEGRAGRIAAAIARLDLPLTHNETELFSIQLASTVTPCPEVHGYVHADGAVFTEVTR